MTDSLSPTPPKWSKLLKLSELLRSGATKVGKYEPKNLPLISSTLESLGKGTEGWAYGDSPIDTRANTPLVNDRTADMLGALPLNTAMSGAGAAKAALLPAIPSMFRFTDLKLAKALTKQVAQADSMRRSGASLEEIWDTTGLYLQPGHSGATTPKGQAKWGFETEPGRFTNSNEWDKFVDDPANMSLPLSAVLDDPALFARVPALKHIEVVTGSKSAQPITGIAHYDKNAGPVGQISIGPKGLRDESDNPAKASQTKHHELNHAINEHFGQMGSTGYGPHPLTSEGSNRISSIVSQLRKTDPNLREAADAFEEIAPDPSLTTQSDYFRKWSNSSGEQLANEAGRRGAIGEFTGINPSSMPRTTDFQVPDNLTSSLTSVLWPIGRGLSTSNLSDETFARQLAMALRKQATP